MTNVRNFINQQLLELLEKADPFEVSENRAEFDDIIEITDYLSGDCDMEDDGTLEAENDREPDQYM